MTTKRKHQRASALATILAFPACLPPGTSQAADAFTADMLAKAGITSPPTELDKARTWPRAVPFNELNELMGLGKLRAIERSFAAPQVGV